MFSFFTRSSPLESTFNKITKKLAVNAYPKNMKSFAPSLAWLVAETTRSFHKQTLPTFKEIPCGQFHQASLYKDTALFEAAMFFSAKAQELAAESSIEADVSGNDEVDYSFDISNGLKIIHLSVASTYPDWNIDNIGKILLARTSEYIENDNDCFVDNYMSAIQRPIPAVSYPTAANFDVTRDMIKSLILIGANECSAGLQESIKRLISVYKSIR